MVSTRNRSRSNANPPRMQNPPGDAASRPSGALEVMQANLDKVEALRLTNQRLIEDLEQLTRQMQRPREARQTQEGHNLTPHEGQHILGTPRGVETEAESSRAKRHEPYLAPGEEGNKATLRGACRGRGTTTSSTRDERAIVGAEVQEPPAGTQPRKGSCKGTSS